jgi:hypothetical protein
MPRLPVRLTCVVHERRAFNSNLDQCNERSFVDVISSTGSERTTRRENFDHDVIDMQCIATSRDGDRNVSTPRFVSAISEGMAAITLTAIEYPSNGERAYNTGESTNVIAVAN